MLQEKKYWNGLLNADDAPFVVGATEYVNAQNFRFGSTDFATGGIGWLESVKGTVSIPGFVFDVDDITLGSCYDPVGNRILFFNHHPFEGPLRTSGVYCYDINADRIYKVLFGEVANYLNFTKEPIHSCFVVNGSLYWTNGTNSIPMRVNIDSGIKTYEPTYASDAVAYTLPIAQSVIAWIRRPPAFPATITKVTQTIPAVEVNRIKDEAFQFAYRYQYRNYEYSTLSPWSTLANYNRPTDTFNRVNVVMPLAEFIEQDVLQVDLVIRFVSGNFFVVKSWNKNVPAEAAEIAAQNANTTALTYAFYNDSRGEAMDQAYSNKPFDSVPVYANTTAAARNRTFFGNYISGYDTPMRTSLVYTTTTAAPTDRNFKSGGVYQIAITFYDQYQRKCGYLAPASGRIVIPEREFGTVNFVTAINWTLSNAAAAAEIPEFAYYYSVDISRCQTTRYFLQLRGKFATYVSKDVNGNYVYGNDTYNTNLAGCAFDISSLLAYNMGYVFAAGDQVKIWTTSALFNLAITGQEGNYIITELQNLGTLDPTTSFLFEIYTPYTPATTELVYEIGKMYEVTTPGDAGRTYGTTSGSILGDVYMVGRKDVNRIVYDMNPLPEPRNDDQAATIGMKPIYQSAVDANFTTGTSPFGGLAGFDITTNNDRWYFKNTGAVDIQIQVAGNIAGKPDSDRTWRIYTEDNILTVTTLIGDKQVVSETPFDYDFNTTITIAPGNRLFIFHEQSVANSMYYYQVNMVILVPSSEIPYNVEAMSPNDKFFRNWNFPDTGRVNAMNALGQSILQNNIAWSNTYIQGTKTNGLSSFETLDTKALPSDCGPLSKLQLTSKEVELGQVMLAICVNETASLYLSENQVVAADANAFLATADNVIGTINILKGSFGTLNPESVKEFRGKVYYYDLRNGKYVQYSENGLFPISNYKVRKFWRLFTEQYSSLTKTEIENMGSRPYVFTGIDMHNEEMLVSVPKIGEPPLGYLPDYPSMIYPFDICDFQAKSLVFRLDVEPNRWGGSYDITAENFCNGQDELYSWKNGEMFKHNAGPFCNFYGQQYKSRIMYLGNQQPDLPKVYFNHHIKANLIPSLTYFRSESPYVQASDLVDYDYRDTEGVFYAAILRDKLVPTATGLSLNGLMTAEDMRADIMRVLMEFTVNATPAQLEFANLGFQMSRGHIKQ